MEKIMINQWSHKYIVILLALLGALFFIPFLGNVHLFDWDEINFAEAAREMLVTGDYLTVQIDYQPFWEKPPLFIWLQVLSMKLFGVNEFAARFPNAVCGMVTMVVLYSVGTHLRNKQLGLLWALFYAGSLLPFFYFKSGIIDPWFNLFIFLGIFFGWRYFSNNMNHILAASLTAGFIGLAMLTKGPVGLLIFALAMGIYLIVKKFKVHARVLDGIIFLVILLFVGGFWFILQILNGNLDVVIDFIVYQIRLFQTQDAGHGGFFLYHFVVLFFGVFPASIFALPALVGNRQTEPGMAGFKRMMQITFWTVLILFTIVSTKIVHYSSMCYFPLTFLAAYNVHAAMEGKPVLSRKWIRLLLLITGLLLSVVLMAFPLVDALKENIIAWGWIDDAFAIEQFRAPVNWTGFEWIVGILMAAVVINSWNRLKKQRYSLMATSLPVFMVVYFMAVLFYVPRAEEYAQRTFIEFLKDKKHEDCYLETQTMKSYAKLFYTRKMPPDNPKAYDEQWLLTGDVDKPVYFIMRNKRADRFARDYPLFRLIKKESGYAFFVREP